MQDTCHLNVDEAGVADGTLLERDLIRREIKRVSNRPVSRELKNIRKILSRSTQYTILQVRTRKIQQLNDRHFVETVDGKIT